MNDTDTKAQLPVHLILGAGEYAKIKTSIPARIGATTRWTDSIRMDYYVTRQGTFRRNQHAIGSDFSYWVRKLRRQDVLGL